MSYIVIMESTFFWHTIHHDRLFFSSKSHPWSISPWPIYYIFKYRRKLTKSLRPNVLQYDDAALKNWQHEGQHMSDLDNARISSYESLHGQTIWNKRTRRSFARLSTDCRDSFLQRTDRLDVFARNRIDFFQLNFLHNSSFLLFSSISRKRKKR